jgi:hypothetical protein
VNKERAKPKDAGRSGWGKFRCFLRPASVEMFPKQPSTTGEHMNRYQRIVSVLFAVVGASCLTGCASDKVALRSGSLSPLRAEQQVNVRYSYEGMRVGNFVSEDAYLEKRAAQLDKKTPGRGALWRKAWVDDRSRMFEPKFEELLNKVLTKEGCTLRFGIVPEAKYTLILRTTFTEPGYNVHVSARPSFISAEAALVETHNPANTVAVIMLNKMPGHDAWSGVDYDTGARLTESYAKAGKELGKFLCKKIK